MGRYPGRSTFVWLTLAALALRVAVPAGLMPSALADGWFLKLCPDGQPAHVVAALLGQSANQHDHAHHGPGDSDAPADMAPCELGAGLGQAAVAATAEPLPTAMGAALPVIAAPQRSWAQTPRTSYHSRAPPLRQSA